MILAIFLTEFPYRTPLDPLKEPFEEPLYSLISGYWALWEPYS